MEKHTVERVPRAEFKWLHVHKTKQTLRSTAQCKGNIFYGVKDEYIKKM